jgi:hypothetical protein
MTWQVSVHLPNIKFYSAQWLWSSFMHKEKVTDRAILTGCLQGWECTQKQDLITGRFKNPSLNYQYRLALGIIRLMFFPWRYSNWNVMESSRKHSIFVFMHIQHPHSISVLLPHIIIDKILAAEWMAFQLCIWEVPTSYRHGELAILRHSVDYLCSSVP